MDVILPNKKMVRLAVIALIASCLGGLLPWFRGGNFFISGIMGDGIFVVVFSVLGLIAMKHYRKKQILLLRHCLAVLASGLITFVLSFVTFFSFMISAATGAVIYAASTTTASISLLTSTASLSQSMVVFPEDLFITGLTFGKFTPRLFDALSDFYGGIYGLFGTMSAGPHESIISVGVFLCMLAGFVTGICGYYLFLKRRAAGQPAK
jgi:hypothetical protein